MTKGVVPGSDGAGTIIAIGKRVTRFKEGDKVCTILNQGHLAGSLNPQSLQTSLGGSLDGTLRQYGVFEESGLVHMPKTLNFNEASTLPCAAVTAWNALYGLQGRPLKPGTFFLNTCWLQFPPCSCFVMVSAKQSFVLPYCESLAATQTD